MPKIADIQETPNPNAVKFILKEPVSHGTSHSYPSADVAKSDKLANSLFEVGDVVSVFYMDKMITVEKTDDVEWDEVLPLLAVPIRAAEGLVVAKTNGNAAASIGGAIAAAAGDDPRSRSILWTIGSAHTSRVTAGGWNIRTVGPHAGIHIKSLWNCQVHLLEHLWRSRT
jgi:hypothetical protein